MPPMGRRVSPGEFELLRQAVADNARRIDRTVPDSQGVAVVTSQLVDLKADVAGLAVRFDLHEKEHRVETADRRSSRRWMIGAAIAFLAMVEAPLGILVAHIR